MCIRDRVVNATLMSWLGHSMPPWYGTHLLVLYAPWYSIYLLVPSATLVWRKVSSQMTQEGGR